MTVKILKISFLLTWIIWPVSRSRTSENPIGQLSVFKIITIEYFIFFASSHVTCKHAPFSSSLKKKMMKYFKKFIFRKKYISRKKCRQQTLKFSVKKQKYFWSKNIFIFWQNIFDDSFLTSTYCACDIFCRSIKSETFSSSIGVRMAVKCGKVFEQSPRIRTCSNWGALRKYIFNSEEI